MLRPSHILLCTIVLVSGCADVVAYEHPSTGSPCDNWGGAQLSVPDENGAQTIVGCDRGRVFNGVIYPEVARDSNLCGEWEVRGGGDCIEYCARHFGTGEQYYSSRTCIVDPVPPSREIETPWDVTLAGCEAIFGGLPEDGDPCVGHAWGCAGYVEQGSPTTIQEMMMWCDTGTLRVAMLMPISITSLPDILEFPDAGSP